MPWARHFVTRKPQIELAEEDLVVTPVRAGDQPVWQGPRGVSITHLPTGLTEVWTAGKSQLENTSAALSMLRERVQEH